jgi:hypothetical protein
MKIHGTKLAGCVLALCTLWGTAQAQTQYQGLTQRAGDAAMSLQQNRTATGIPYITGGIGDVAQDRFKSMARQGGYNMMLVFTFNTGEYLADVDVNVRGPGGVAFDVVTDGPFLAAQVPPGNYTVTARYKGNVDSQQVGVGAGGTRTAFLRFPVGPDAGIVFAGNEMRSAGNEMRRVDQSNVMAPSGARMYVR